MKHLIKWIPIGIALSLLFGCQDEIPEKEMIRPIRAIQVGDPAEFTQRSFPGQAKATKEVDLSFRVAGPLIERPISVGDTVRTGDELAQIDPRDFEVDLQRVEGQLSQARAVLKRAEADYERVLRVQKQDAGAVSQALIDRTRQQMESSRAEIRSFQASVAAAKDQLSYTRLNAPFEGIITAIYVENHEDVKAKQPIARMIDHSQIEMIVNIPENLISHADYLKSAGNVLRVHFDPFPDHEIDASIKEIGKEASRTTRTYPVTLIMDQPQDFKILPGMAGNASSSVKPAESEGFGGIAIPETAVLSPEGNDKTYVWIIDEKTETVTRREVTTGALLDTGIIVKTGIEPGEWVATAGVNFIRDGQKVRLIKPSAEEVTQ
jgi:RND family efflux transporter MFP subunit